MMMVVRDTTGVQITLEKEAFDEVMELLEISNPVCAFCEEKVDKNNFGLIHKDGLYCKSIMCLSGALERGVLE